MRFLALATLPAIVIFWACVLSFAVAGHGTDWTFVVIACGLTLFLGVVSAITDRLESRL